MDYLFGKGGLPFRAAEGFVQMIFPLDTYCLCCGKAVDRTRSYSICDHCIRRITWGNIRIDLEAESSRLGRPARLDSAVACVKYGLYERRLIFDLKYDGRTYVARAIGHIMADRLCAGDIGGVGLDYRSGGGHVGHAGDRLCDSGGLGTLSPADEAAVSASGGTAGHLGVCGNPGAPGCQQSRGGLGGWDYIVPVPVHRDKEKARGFNQAEKMARHLSHRIGVPVLPRAIIRNRNTTAQRGLSAEDRYFNLEGAFSINDKDECRIAGSRILLLDDVYTTGATAHQCGRVLKDAGAARVDFIAFATGNDFASGFFAISD